MNYKQFPEIGPTVEIVREASKTMARLSKDLDRKTDEIEKTGDLSIAGEVAPDILNAAAACRLDLLVVRPVRAYEQMRRNEP